MPGNSRITGRCTYCLGNNNPSLYSFKQNSAYVKCRCKVETRPATSGCPVHREASGGSCTAVDGSRSVTAQPQCKLPRSLSRNVASCTSQCPVQSGLEANPGLPPSPDVRLILRGDELRTRVAEELDRVPHGRLRVAVVTVLRPLGQSLHRLARHGRRAQLPGVRGAVGAAADRLVEDLLPRRRLRRRR